MSLSGELFTVMLRPWVWCPALKKERKKDKIRQKSLNISKELRECYICFLKVYEYNFYF
jgi:hypothetical protein